MNNSTVHFDPSLKSVVIRKTQTLNLNILVLPLNLNLYIVALKCKNNVLIFCILGIDSLQRK